MNGQRHSYLDLSVLKELRHSVLSKDAVVVCNELVTEIIWANAAGAQLFGGKGIVDLISTNISESQTIIRQIKNSISKMGKENSIVRGFRVNQGFRPLIIQFEIKRIKLPFEDTAYKITNYTSNQESVSEKTLSKNAVASLEGFADAAAILDSDGKPLAATSDFKNLAPSPKILNYMVSELQEEKDRLIKRTEENDAGDIMAIGLARLSKSPSRNLIVLANTFVEETDATSDAVFESTEKTQILDADKFEEKNPEENTASIETPEPQETTYADEDLINSIFDDTQFPQQNPVEDDTPLVEAKGELETENEQTKFNFENSEGTVRFAWVVDEDCIFKTVSPELAEVVGKNSAAIIGREWREVANVFNFDNDHEIEKLLKKQDTWSGKSVLWPVQGTDLVLPIDLAALPTFNSDRNFAGFRGFGIIRSADAMIDPEATGLALVSGMSDQKNFNTSNNELPKDINPTVLEDNNKLDEGSNVVKLIPKGFKPAQSKLTQQEDYAFKKIGETLRGSDEDLAKFDAFIDSKEEIPSAFTSTNRSDDNEMMDASLVTDRDTNKLEIQSKKESDLSKDQPIKAFSPAGLDTSIMETLPVAIVIYNSEEILFTNKSFLETTGYSTARELEESGGIEAILAPLSIQDDAEKCLLTTKTGQQIAIEPVLHTIPWSGQKALLISFKTNSTDENPSQEPPALEMSSISEIQNILDITSDGILVLDPTGKIISINASAEALFNISFDQAKNTDITSFFATESRSSVRHYTESITSPGNETLFNDGLEVIASETTGGMIPVFLTISKMQSSGKLCAVIRDMTNWKKAEEELIQSRHEAEAASGQKSDFLANISHEIRTPLNSIIGFSDIMIEERFGPITNERYREYLRDINRSGTHVLELINDLLDLSKIEAGKLELEFEAVDLNELVSESVALLQPQANDSRILIRTSLSRAVPKVVADIRSIRQIILNLVSNAIKFSPINSQVIVSTVYESNGEVALRIRDTGHGMSEEQIKQALKPFQQIHQNKQDRNDGTGLGLSLTTALVKANRAVFDLESEPGQGTIAHVQFPTQRVLAD